MLGGNKSAPDACFPNEASICGDKFRSAGEECDDGNQNGGDGCSAECLVEAGYNCIVLSSPPFPCQAQGDYCAPVCGDGKRVGHEADRIGFWAGSYCEDGNAKSSDGCSDSCSIECGFSCTAASVNTDLDICSPSCGDGIFSHGEDCEDGNSANGDGCSSSCLVEHGWKCTGEICGISDCVCSAPRVVDMFKGALRCACLPGYFEDSDGTCVGCIAGTFKNFSGPEPCVSCEAGKFSNEAGQTACFDCKADSVSLLGSSSPLSCLCRLGYSGPNGGICSACPPGHFKDELGPAGCSLCDAGKFSTEFAGDVILNP